MSHSTDPTLPPGTHPLPTISSNGSQCRDESLPDDVMIFLYYGWGVIGTVLVGCGLVGNVLSIIVLSHPRMRSATSCYLVALAIYDSLVLISLLVSFSLPMLSAEYRRFVPHINQMAYPLALMAQTCSIYTTVGFTVERYLAVCHPLQSSKLCTIPRARKAILLTLTCSILYNIPRMFEYQVISVGDCIHTEPTALGRNHLFRHVYFVGLHMFVFFLIPFCTLMLLNTLLIRAVRRSQRTQQRMCNRTQRENNLTIMLTVVVAAFLVCELPSIADNIMSVVLGDRAHEPGPVKFSVVCNLLVITNSAINFYLYCLFGNKFRRVFVDVIFKLQCAGGALRYQAASILRHESSSFRASPSFRMNGYVPVKTENGNPRVKNGSSGVGKRGVYLDHLDTDRAVHHGGNNFLSPSPLNRSNSDIYV